MRQNDMLLVIATTNKGKTQEIIKLLENFPVTVKNLNDFSSVPDIVEDGRNFQENACKKAVEISRYLNLPALADDSGLVVEALGGAPGIHSARYAGEHATDTQRCRKLLHEMDAHTNRRAAFHCVISIAVPNGKCLTYTGDCNGLITRSPAGSNGFGYDPVFYYPPLNQTFAQISMEEKSRISHRGKALEKFMKDFQNAQAWILENLTTT